jgi:hypothetical protein
MKRYLGAPALLTALVLVPVAFAACHKGSGGSGSAANNDNGGADDDGGAHAGGRKGHGKSADNGDGGASAPMAALVINKPTPEPIAPPDLKKTVTMPSLPNLPSPSKYPKAGPIPKGKDVVEDCGQVWSGEEYVPVECLDPDVNSNDAKAAKVVIPYDKMKALSEELPKLVDHRADGTEGPIRKQGGPQCTAFAFTSALDHAFARWTGTPASLSVMQVWARYHRKQERAAADSNVGDFLVSEADWPYDAKEANTWVPCHSNKKPDQVCGKSPDDKRLTELEPKAVAELTQIEVVPLTQLEVLREKIAGGQDVTVAIKLPSFALAGDPGAKYIVGVSKDKPEAKPVGAHQILLSGYAMTPNGNYYLVHNSWGTKWGDGGYAWLHEDLLKAYWADKLMVIPDVQPKQIAELRSRAHGHLTEKCGEGKVPDSISGMCAGKCSDGSPRHNNACAKETKEKCPAGMINLTGECVLAAPKGSGKDDVSKVKWECGPGGCVYGIPRDKLDCKEKECEVSCPAPDFRLATTSKGLVCVE